MSRLAEQLKAKSSVQNPPVIKKPENDKPAAAVVFDINRCAHEKEAALRYWRFLHNGTEVDIASGATLAEAYGLLRCGSDDDLEPILSYGHDEPDIEADLEQVTCGDCEHFQPDTVGDGAGIGSCAANAWKPGRGANLYPNADRFCNAFKGEDIMTALPKAIHGRPRGFIDWRPQQETAALIEKVQLIIEEFGNYGYDKTEKAYKRLCEMLNRARRGRLVEFDAIRDDGFTRLKVHGWRGIQTKFHKFRKLYTYKTIWLTKICATSSQTKLATEAASDRAWRMPDLDSVRIFVCRTAVSGRSVLVRSFVSNSNEISPIRLRARSFRSAQCCSILLSFTCFAYSCNAADLSNISLTSSIATASASTPSTLKHCRMGP